MSTSHELELAAMSLSLEEREELAAAIEESISIEYDRRAREAVAFEIQRIESMLTRQPLTTKQMESLEEKLAASCEGKGPFPCWENVSREIYSHMRQFG